MEIELDEYSAPFEFSSSADYFSNSFFLNLDRRVYCLTFCGEV